MLKVILVFFTLIIFLCSCSKDEYTIINLNNNKISVLGHGGLGVGVSQYPLDSYEGIEKAVSMGADGSEIDVQITRDSVLVCYHDSYLEDATDMSGEIHALTWNEIKDACYKTPPYKLYKIASLEQVFENSGGAGNLYTFDIKFKSPDQSAANREIFVRAIIRLVEKYQLENKTTIESPDPEFLKSLKAKNKNLNLFIYADFETAYKAALESGFKGITIKAADISAEQVSEAHNKGIMVAVFSTTRLNHDEVIKKNVDIIQTDDLEDLIARLK